MSERIHFLLVEDNLPALTVLKIMVSKFNVQVSTAKDAESAFEFIQKDNFDLLLTDLGLPGMSGDELAKKIRQYEHEHQRKQRMKIIALTGHAIGEISEKCINAGMNDVYRKPITPEVLQKLITPLIHEEKEAQKQGAATKGLGLDLPMTEEALFEIEQYPLLDLTLSEKILGNKETVQAIFKTFKCDGIDEDLTRIKEAYQQKDWATIERLSHKMKGGADYGTVRLAYALLYMERYLKAGHQKCAEQLYAQMLRVIDETLVAIETTFIGTK